MKHAFVLAALILMTGCSAPVWVKPGATQQSFDADKFDCEQKVVTMYGGYSQMGPGHALMAGGDIKNCMRSKGYREQAS